MNPNVVSPFLSQKFRFWSFVSMMLLVFVHGYNLRQTYLQSATVPGEVPSATVFIEYLFSNGLLRFRMPMLFAISGFLFALGDAAPFWPRILKRSRTLVLPYFLWTLIGLGVIYALGIGPWGLAEATKNTYMNLWEDPQFLNAKWYEYLMWFPLHSPVSFQLWFLRALFFLNLMYPGLVWLLQYNKYTRIGLFVVASTMWLIDMELPFFYPEGVLFFSLGIWYAKQGAVPAAPPWGTKAWHWGLACLFFALGKTALAVYLPQMPIADPQPFFTVMHFSHKTVIVTGFVAAWFGLDGLVRACMRNQAFVWCSAFSFFIYALHEPLLHIVMQWSLIYTKTWPMYRMVTYVGVSAATALFCIGVGWLFRTVLPPVYSLLTGSRGLPTPPVLDEKPIRVSVVV